MNSVSAVWKYFKRDAVNSTATCVVGNCKEKLKISAGSTKGLWKHLEFKHKKEFQAFEGPKKGRMKHKTRKIQDRAIVTIRWDSKKPNLPRILLCWNERNQLKMSGMKNLFEYK